MREDSFFLNIAAAEAAKFEGATAPNPPVGACLVREGRLLGVGAHQKAGSPHAEVNAIQEALSNYGKAALQNSTLYVTLEPCNHYGKTPPCTLAILEAGISRVVFGAADPNPNVKGGGAEFLRKAGVEVAELKSAACELLVAGFRKRVLEGLPWVLHKIACRFTEDGALSMIPEKGKRTFTEQSSLKLAHIERRKSDAILTTLKTVLADEPYFTVREVEDHPGKKRQLSILGSDFSKLPEAWVRRQEALGFEILRETSFQQALQNLAEKGALRVLVEAGPKLSTAIETDNLWDERLVFIQTKNGTDIVHREIACSPES